MNRPKQKPQQLELFAEPLPRSMWRAGALQDVPERTAQVYMRLAKLSEVESAAAADLSIEATLKALRKKPKGVVNA